MRESGCMTTEVMRSSHKRGGSPGTSARSKNSCASRRDATNRREIVLEDLQSQGLGIADVEGRLEMRRLLESCLPQSLIELRALAGRWPGQRIGHALTSLRHPQCVKMGQVSISLRPHPALTAQSMPMETPVPTSAVRVAEAAARAGLATRVIEMTVATRTAEEAAHACGCDAAQIVKSLIFRGRTTGVPYLLLVSGRNRVDETKVAGVIGESITRPDAAYVRDITGFAIGGIPPIGHANRLLTYIDIDLLGFTEVWAAAGTPRCVMKLDPQALKRAVDATEIAVC